jgi:hypothetical protein
MTFLHYDATALWQHLAERLEASASPGWVLMAEMARDSRLPGLAGPSLDLELEVELARVLIRAAADVGAVRGPTPRI